MIGFDHFVMNIVSQCARQTNINMLLTSLELKCMWVVLKGIRIDWKNPVFSKQLDSAD